MPKHLATLLLAGAGAAALAQPAPPPVSPPQRLRGTLEQVQPHQLTLRERRGEVLMLALPDNLILNEVMPISLADIQPGSYIGAAALPQADGVLVALEVLVFPEAMRGVGEGHYPWDLQPDSTMTNATVAELAATPNGRRLQLKYKSGEKTLLVPATAPVVTLKPAERALLTPGAHVLITAVEREGKPTAIRMLVGRNGFAPPM